MIPDGMVPLWTPEEVANLFRVQPRTVLAWARDGRLEAVRPSASVIRFSDAAVQAAWGSGDMDGNGHAGRAPGSAERAPPAPRERAPCPDDTNGDGDCGRRLCPHCGREPMAGRDFDIDGQSWGA